MDDADARQAGRIEKCSWFEERVLESRSLMAVTQVQQAR